MTESVAAAAFRGCAGKALDEMLETSPTLATELGHHRHDDRLDDISPQGRAAERGRIGARLAALDAIDVASLGSADAVDAQILRNRLEYRAYQLDELRDFEWDPLVSNPGTAIYLLLARDFAPLPDRLRSVLGRLARIPEHLDVARRALGHMPQVHVETAIGQFIGTRTMLVTEIDRALEAEPALRGEVDPARQAALSALDAHIDWLRAALDDPPRVSRDPRIGAERLHRKLAYTLDAASDADAILARADEHLMQVEEHIAETAGELSGRSPSEPGLVREVLDRLASEAPVDDLTIIGLCRDALASTAAFVREHDLVTVYDDPVEIIVMPEIHRGVAVAYCDPPGPLETRALPTFFAVAPTPAEWTPERVDSFYREYNQHMLQNLTVHEAMPGHVLQLAHSARYFGGTPIRKALWSGSFVEGWAVYAEELMARSGYRRNIGEKANLALRLHQLKMQLRMVINAILDIRVHAHGMTESEAMTLMMQRGHQEEGEAAGKWRRAQLTSAQLATYFVGYTEVADIARDLRTAHPGWPQRRVHDEMLAHGSPAPRHLRTLFEL